MSVPVSGVSVDPTSVIVTLGSYFRAAATVAPPNATNPSLVWGSGNVAVATVDAQGCVHAVGLGSTAIQVSTVVGGFVAVISVSVVPTPPPCPVPCCLPRRPLLCF
jgi:uncharacterized protein YjdB